MRIKARNGERQESEKGDRANAKQTVQRKERNTQFVLQNSHVGVIRSSRFHARVDWLFRWILRFINVILYHYDW